MKIILVTTKNYLTHHYNVSRLRHDIVIKQRCGKKSSLFVKDVITSVLLERFGTKILPEQLSSRPQAADAGVIPVSLYRSV